MISTVVTIVAVTPEMFVVVFVSLARIGSGSTKVSKARVACPATVATMTKTVKRRIAPMMRGR